MKLTRKLNFENMGYFPALATGLCVHETYLFSLSLRGYGRWFKF